MHIKLNIPDGKSGDWAVSNFVITEDHATILSIFWPKHEAGREIPPGEYVRLMHKQPDGHVICYMSNTPAEVRDHEVFVKHAAGDVLINGLGLGMCVAGILNNGNNVRSITIIEKSQDVINLVGPYITDQRVNIICDDAFEYKTDMTYDFVWHDIWPTINWENLIEMGRLYLKYKNISAWQGAWAFDICLERFKEKSFKEYKAIQEIKNMYLNMEVA